MIDLNALKQEIELDPAGRGYAGKTAEEQAALVSQPYTTAYGEVEIRKILIWAATSGAFTKLQAIAPGDPLYDPAQAFLAIFKSGVIPALNLGDAQVEAMADAFVAANVFTSEQKDQLFAMGAIATSRADELGFDVVWPGHVMEALQR